MRHQDSLICWPLWWLLFACLTVIHAQTLLAQAGEDSTQAVAANATVWQRHVIDNTSQGADGVRLADFNRDGKLDVVTGWEQGGVTRVYLQPETKRVRSPWPAVTVGSNTKSVEDAVAVDLDGDGALDVVSSCEGRTRTLFVHWSPKQQANLLDETKWETKPFPQSVGKQAWMFCLPLQVDGKLGIDLVTGSKNPNAAVGWWESPEDPRDLSAWKYHRLAKAGWIMSLFARDLDSDGDQDIIYVDRKTETRGVKWLRRPVSNRVTDPEAWESETISNDTKEFLFANLGDVDGDGLEDLVQATRNGTVDLARRIPGTKPIWRWNSILNPFGLAHGKSVTIADFNQDGRNDIAITLRSKPVDGPAVAIMEFQDSPWSNAWSSKDIGGPDGSKFDLLEPIDLDGDGDLDLITCEEVKNLGVIWYENPLLD